jgi:hypothetical protein
MDEWQGTWTRSCGGERLLVSAAAHGTKEKQQEEETGLRQVD